MLKKRLIGVVTVKNGLAVQSFGYRRHLPLGKPEWLVENLDRWGADEILVQCIDRSTNRSGPDFSLLERLARMGLGTPLIYGGGIASADDALRVVQGGADRVAVDALLHGDPAILTELGYQLGVQALVGAVPLRMAAQEPVWFDYRTRLDRPLSALRQIAARGLVSELLVIDVEHEGQDSGFTPALIDQLDVGDTPLLAFGGISRTAQMQELLTRERVAAICVGNFLSYRELAVQQYKQTLASPDLRPEQYAADHPRPVP